MEDKTPLPTTPPAARTAEALRQLHDRARNALAAQRERMSLLESQLTQQLDSIADTLSSQLAEHGQQADGTDAEQVRLSVLDVEKFRAELDQARADWHNERVQSEIEAAERAERLDTRLAELDAREQTFNAREQMLDERSTTLNQQEHELGERRTTLDAEIAQSAANQSELVATQNTLAQQSADLAQKLSDQTQRAAEVEARAQSLDIGEKSLAAERIAFQQERIAFEAAEAELDARRNKLTAEQTTLAAERTEFVAQQNAAAFASQSNSDELQAQLANLQQQVATDRAARELERTNIDEQRRLLAKERDELSTALDAARAELAATRVELTTAKELSGAASERDELQQKFDLALDDLQRLRGRVAELEQDLESRPAADETESVELVHLRSERDAMAERIAELEKKGAVPEDADTAQERADLQRRFELAVEDVRDLKKKNAELESRLASASTHAPSSASVGGSNWEAMKRKMLANLEGEDDDGDEERREERATIESTIRITDEALERKDREIAELKERLAETRTVSDRDDQVEAVRQLVDADSIIVEHRERIAKLETEMNDKLRAAELEISVERAKLAREKVQLADLRAEIDAHRPLEPLGGGAVPPQPKRRWLSKLGLGDDEG